MKFNYYVTALLFALLCLAFPSARNFGQCLPTNVTTKSGDTEVTTCPGDGEADFVRFKPTSWVAGYVWVITDTSNTILDHFFGNKFDFENAGAGECRVWGVSHAGYLVIPTGEDILTADFQSFCWIVSTNYVTINRVIPDGANVSLPNGDTLTYLCPGDGIPDVVAFTNNSQAANDYGYVITDENGVIIGAAADDSYDFDSLPLGVCRVYGVAFTGNLTVSAGEDVFTANLSDGCNELSDNFVEIIKDEPEGGTVSLSSGGTNKHVCVGDGNPNVVEFTATNTSNLFYAYVITDETESFLAVTFNDSYDFESAPPGDCRVYGVAYAGDFTIQPGENVFSTPLTDHCFDLSENFIVIKKSEPNGSFVSLTDGTTQTFTCPGDGVADVIEFSTSSGSTANYAFLITDENGQILTVPNGNSHDFEATPAGICRVYGMSYVDILLAEAGMDLNTDVLADDCWDLSNNFIEIVREAPVGGSISTPAGEQMVYTCPGDGNPDVVEFVISDASNSQVVYLVTDDNNEVVAILDQNSFDFNGMNTGICRVYGVAFTGNLLLIEGDTLGTTDISDDCFDLTQNYIEVIRDVPDGGAVATLSGSDLVYTCPGDGKEDVIQFENQGTSNSKFAYLILDENLLVSDVATGDNYDFDGLGEGLSAVIGLSYTGNLTVQTGDDPFFTPLSDDCYDLSDNWIDVVHFTPKGGTVATLGGATSVDICSGDGLSDVVEYEATDAAVVPYFYILTDDNNEILNFSPIPSMDFEGVTEGLCRIYGLSFTGNFTGIIGENITDIPLSDDCYDLSDNYIEVTRRFVEGGEISTALGDTQIYICPADGNPNVVDFTTTSTASVADFVFIITDNQHLITNVLPGDSYDFENDGIGISKVWGVSFTGNLLAQIGSKVDEIALSDGCYSLGSNFIEVIRDQPNGDLITSDYADMADICVGDGLSDEITFVTGSFSFAQYVFLITDENNEILGIVDDLTHDFEDAGAGICRVWGLSFTGHLTAEAGDLIDFDPLSDDCFDLSGNFVQVNRTAVEGGIVFSPSGDEIFLCVGDGLPDFVGFFNNSQAGNDYRYLVTDEDGILLDVLNFNLYDFEIGNVGTCRVYGLDFTGTLSTSVGENIFNTPLSTECFGLSSNFITVHKSIPDGGTVATDQGETSVTVTVDDGEPDVINFVASGASNSKYAFAITDDNNVILTLPPDDFADFEGGEEGICRVWGLAYTGGIQASPGEVITDVDLATGCEDLSDNFIEVIREDSDSLVVAGGFPDGNFEHLDIGNDFLSELKLAPNPVSGRLNISFLSVDFEGLSHIRVFNISGQKIYEKEIGTVKGFNETQIEVGDFTEGFYYFLIYNEKVLLSSGFVKK